MAQKSHSRASSHAENHSPTSLHRLSLRSYDHNHNHNHSPSHAHPHDMALADPIMATEAGSYHDHFAEGHLPRILLGPARSEGNASTAEQNIAISATSRQAGQMVAPFLAEHIPEQYNPFSRPQAAAQTSTAEPKQTNTKYCYRHRPDLKCRRQANEPSMGQLQNVRHWIFPGHATRDCWS
jgi:hypothetical protein